MLTQLNITSWRNIVGCWVSTRAANKVSVFDDMGMRLNQLSFPGNFHILAFNTIFILFFIGNTRGITVVLHYSIWLASKNGVVLEGELDVGRPGSSPGRVCTPSVTGWVLRLSPAWSPLSPLFPFVLSNKGTKNDPEDEESDVSHIEMNEWWKWLPVCCLQVLGSQLRILSASPEDSGEYICRVQGNPGNPGSHVHQASVSVSVTSSSSRKLVNACRYHTGGVVLSL